ncbi:glycosyltransferase family 39 protein [Lyngbya aestuarii]|uniref:glycosyltransferase family 39 protein n=1 Tax=Lyngbya aestuarii TaxID=118322 RepID=UPI00403D9574
MFVAKVIKLVNQFILKKNVTSSGKPRLNKLQILVVVLLILGILLRFYNLDRKVYWGDEVYTSLRISGYTETELVQRVFTGDVISQQDLQKYQHPNSEKDLRDTIDALVSKPEHPPLYYLMARFWVQSFGSSVAVIRSLSALISLLAFPCIYWLCLELFNSPSTGLVAVALLAVSPFHVLFAQEARQYSLWIVTILLSSAALLRAIRLKTKVGWVVYTITVALGFYSHLLYGLVALGQGIYVFVLEKLRWTKIVTAYCFAAITALLAFSPWLWVIVTRFAKLQSNTAHLSQDKSNFILLWLLNLSRIFTDFNQGPSAINPLLYLIAILAGYSLYILCRETAKPTWLFILTLTGVTGLALIMSDLILGGQRSTIARYPIPCYLGIQLAVAYLLTSKITSFSASHQQRKRWRLTMNFLLFSGILSCVINSQMMVWWNKGPFKTRYNPQIAQIINQAEQPLLISDSSAERVLSLSYLLKPKVKLQLVVAPTMPKIPSGFSDVFLYQPSDQLRSQLEKDANLQLEKVYKSWLWKI